MSDRDLIQDEYTKEHRILGMVKHVLTDVARDTHAPPGTKHPLTARTIEGIRDCLSLIASRELEIAEARGQTNTMRPRYADEPVQGGPVKINIDGLRRRKPDH